MSDLPERLREAVRAIQDAQVRDPEFRAAYFRHADDGVGFKVRLSEVANRIAAKEREAAEREALVEELALSIFQLGAQAGLHAHRQSYEDYTGKAALRGTARKLIESGWRMRGDVMNDSRIAQARALVDDARCLLAEIDEEKPPEEWDRSPHDWRNLNKARVSLNHGLYHLHRLEKE